MVTLVSYLGGNVAILVQFKQESNSNLIQIRFVVDLIIVKLNWNMKLISSSMLVTSMWSRIILIKRNVPSEVLVGEN